MEILPALIEKYKDQICVLDMESPRQECDEQRAVQKAQVEAFLKVV